MQVVTRERAQSGHVTQMSQYSETKRVTECEWRNAPEARRGLWRIERKLESRVLVAKREGPTFGARRREATLRPMGAARDGGQMNKTA